MPTPSDLRRQYSDDEWEATIQSADPRRKSLLVVPEGFGHKGAHGRSLEFKRLARNGLVVTLDMLSRLMTGKEFDEIDCEVVEKLVVRPGGCKAGQTDLLLSMIPKFVNLVILIVHFDKVETRLDLRESVTLRRLWVDTKGHCMLLPARNLEGLTLTGNITFTAIPSSLTFFSANDVRQSFTVAEDNRFGQSDNLLKLSSRGHYTVRVPHSLRESHMEVSGLRVERYGGYVSGSDSDDSGDESDCTDIVVDEAELTRFEAIPCSACLVDMTAGIAVYTCRHLICAGCVARFRQLRGRPRVPRFEAMQACGQCRAEPPRVMRF
jgi:hypothetical protein